MLPFSSFFSSPTLAPYETQIAVGDHVIPVMIRKHPRRHRLTLRFHQSHPGLLLSAPSYCTDRKIKTFLDTHRPWIEKHLHQLVLPFRIIRENVPVAILDIPTCFSYRSSPHTRFIIEPSRIIIQGPSKENFSLIAHHALKTHAHSFFLKKSLIYACQIGKSVKHVTIKDYKSRWGSCTHEGNLSFSWRLLFAPKDVASYVCAHEVAHLQEMNHQKAFWNLVEKLCPHFRESKTWLTTHGRSLFNYKVIPSEE